MLLGRTSPLQSPRNSPPSPAPSAANLFIVPVELCMIHAPPFMICADYILAHSPLCDGAGSPRIPRVADFTGAFIAVPESREFRSCEFPGAILKCDTSTLPKEKLQKRKV